VDQPTRVDTGGDSVNNSARRLRIVDRFRRCTRNSTFTACNWRHLDFCAHWGVDAHVIACKDFPGRLNKTGIEYWVGTYRDVRSTPSRIYATSSGVIQARFLAIDHLTREYIGCSRQVDFSGSGNSFAWDCGLV
jgi:hypothetical protein